MKKIREWFELLPEEHKSKALKSMVNGETEQESMVAALSNGLIWKHTPEGKEYWSKVFDKYLQQLIIKDLKAEKV
jgi:N-glycosylase/DNA lyase